MTSVGSRLNDNEKDRPQEKGADRNNDHEKRIVVLCLAGGAVWFHLDVYRICSQTDGWHRSDWLWCPWH